MLGAIADWARLAGAMWRLSRFDALAPKEYEDLLPAVLRPLAALTRIGARRTVDGRALRPGERLAAAFEGMGPAYIKLGQFMATRPDIVGFEVAGDLARLQDRMPPFSRAQAVKEIERAFGRPIDALFASFSEPVAAASVAQVHKAETVSGQTVAVKVLRPQIERLAFREFRAFARAARALERVSVAARRLEPVQFIETLRAAATVELDLRMEAGAASAMADSLRTKEGVYAPAVVWAQTSRRVLTLDWIEGASVSDVAALDARGVDRRAMAVKIMQLFLTQALHEGFFHADMHQGNLLVDARGRLALIDFGIMGRLDEPTRDAFAEIIHGFVQRDYQRTAEAHFRAGYIDRSHSVEAFAQALRSVGEPLYGRTADAVDMSRVLQQLFDVTDLFDMHLRPELVLLQRTMVTVEGVARLLDPQINMWEAAAPIVKDYVANTLGPARRLRRLRDAAEKAAEIAPHLPDYLTKIAAASERIAADGSDALLLEGPAAPRRAGRAALWFAGASALALAVSVMLAR